MLLTRQCPTIDEVEMYATGMNPTQEEDFAFEKHLGSCPACNVLYLKVLEETLHNTKYHC